MSIASRRHQREAPTRLRRSRLEACVMSDHARLTHLTTILVLTVALSGPVACTRGGGLEGTYHHPAGAFVLELRDGHEAVVQMLGQSVRCRWDSTAEQVKLSCPDSNIFTQQIGTLARNDDGTLSSGLGVLAKRPPS